VAGGATGALFCAASLAAAVSLAAPVEEVPDRLQPVNASSTARALVVNHRREAFVFISGLDRVGNERVEGGDGNGCGATGRAARDAGAAKAGS